MLEADLISIHNHAKTDSAELYHIHHVKGAIKVSEIGRIPMILQSLLGRIRIHGPVPSTIHFLDLSVAHT